MSVKYLQKTQVLLANRVPEVSFNSKIRFSLESLNIFRKIYDLICLIEDNRRIVWYPPGPVQ